MANTCSDANALKPKRPANNNAVQSIRAAHCAADDKAYRNALKSFCSTNCKAHEPVCAAHCAAYQDAYAEPHESHCCTISKPDKSDCFANASPIGSTLVCSHCCAIAADGPSHDQPYCRAHHQTDAKPINCTQCFADRDAIV
jgi:hypothetical protein